MASATCRLIHLGLSATSPTCLMVGPNWPKLNLGHPLAAIIFLVVWATSCVQESRPSVNRSSTQGRHAAGPFRFRTDPPTRTPRPLRPRPPARPEIGRAHV